VDILEEKARHEGDELGFHGLFGSGVHIFYVDFPGGALDF